MTAQAEVGQDKTPLEDLMVAMDVVDTVRHRQLIVDRELDSAGRRERLIERLREIYTAQGIEVTDAALEAGVDALEEERFGHTPPAASLSVSLARFYVRRDRWLKPLGMFVALLALLATGWYYTVEAPRARMEAAIPARIEATHTAVLAAARSENVTARANELLAESRRALNADNFEAAQAVADDLDALRRNVDSSYEIRIVSRPNELSGVWRVPDVNPNARNYYLIVEAVDSGGNILRQRIRNEEDGRYYTVSSWGVRVEQNVFESVAADKQDDGIIQNFVLGSKAAGFLDPEYRVPTSGATITRW